MGSVYCPGQVDSQGDVMTKGEIRKMAYNFLMRGRTDCIDVRHDRKKSGCLVCESFIIRGDGDPDGFLDGEWVMTVKVEDEAIWDACKRGEFNGFSFYGRGDEYSEVEMITQAVSMKGDTEESKAGPFPSHTHSISLKFDDDARIIPTHSGETLGHSHWIEKATATEMEFDHAHRMVLSE